MGNAKRVVKTKVEIETKVDKEITAIPQSKTRTDADIDFNIQYDEWLEYGKPGEPFEYIPGRCWRPGGL